MRKSCLAVVLCAFAVLLAAPAAGHGTEVEDAGTVTITVRDCKRLLVHTARPDVTYKPGVDVRGKKVASPDYAGDIKLKLPDDYAFDIPVDLRRFMGGPAADAKAHAAPTAQAFEEAARIGAAEATVGTVRYNINSGRLTFNGQSLTPEAEAELAHKCREMMTRER